MLYRTPPEEHPDRKPIIPGRWLILDLWHNDRELVIMVTVIAGAVLASVLSQVLS